MGAVCGKPKAEEHKAASPPKTAPQAAGVSEHAGAASLAVMDLRAGGPVAAAPPPAAATLPAVPPAPGLSVPPTPPEVPRGDAAARPSETEEPDEGVAEAQAEAQVSPRSHPLAGEDSFVSEAGEEDSTGVAGFIAIHPSAAGTPQDTPVPKSHVAPRPPPSPAVREYPPVLSPPTAAKPSKEEVPRQQAPPELRAGAPGEDVLMHSAEEAGAACARDMQTGALPDPQAAHAFAESARAAQRSGVPSAVLLRGVPLAQVPLGKEDSKEREHITGVRSRPPPSPRVADEPHLTMEAMEPAELFTATGDEPGSKGRSGAADHRLAHLNERESIAAFSPPRSLPNQAASFGAPPRLARTAEAATPPRASGAAVTEASPAQKRSAYADAAVAAAADVNVTLWRSSDVSMGGRGVPLTKARMRAKSASVGSGGSEKRLLAVVRQALADSPALRGSSEVAAVFALDGQQVFSCEQLQANGNYLVCTRGEMPDLEKLPAELRKLAKKARLSAPPATPPPSPADI